MADFAPDLVAAVTSAIGQHMILRESPDQIAAAVLLAIGEQARIVPKTPPAPRGTGVGVAMIAAERARQVTAEGWTAEHDAQHTRGELARAAACYATPPDQRQVGTRLAAGFGDRGDRYASFPLGWPWHPDWWKPGDRLSELVKAGGLCAAEIDRLTAEENGRG